MPRFLGPFSLRELLAGALVSLIAPCSFGATVVKPNRPQKETAAQNTPQEVLASCAQFARDFAPEERAFVMVRIAYYASIHHFPQSEKWARQAFTVSSDLPGSWNKTALQKNALVALAATQPMEALHLLGTLAAEKPNESGPKIPEDVRADAARVIFANAYRKDPNESLSSMLEVSDYLGRTGEYPYGAWRIVLPKIEKSHPATFNEVISTAIRFYGDGEARTRSHDEEYFDMVNEIRAVANRSQMQLAVSAAIERLQAESPPKDETYFAVVGHGIQKSGFNDPSKELLYQWLPLVKEFDSADYEDLAKKLNAAGSAARNSQEGSVEVLTNPKNMTPKLQQWAQDHLQAEAVENDASSNPDLAIRESAGIYSMALRSDALSRGAMTAPSKKRCRNGENCWQKPSVISTRCIQKMPIIYGQSPIWQMHMQNRKCVKALYLCYVMDSMKALKF